MLFCWLFHFEITAVVHNFSEACHILREECFKNFLPSSIGKHVYLNPHSLDDI